MAYDLNDKREHILAIVSDLVSSFLYYDRKVATGWPQTGDIQQAVKDGILTVDDIVAEFRGSLEEHL